ncbi:MAG: LamG-like jellyroll fold domain-containing protein [Deltaproteobacteria bacterium]|nr:LamG-like jellyroll fold domain-containing protein [Deltaproteobacteria bacterium]
MITRQVKKGNMLVVLDTSGSMTGVPGEPFDAATELGVDCDLGEDCREVTQTGQCLISKHPLSNEPRLCSNDAQCRVGNCKFGGDPCLQDFDCPSVNSVCTATGKPCQYNADCGPQGSTCKISGLYCSSIQPCQPAGRCSDTNAVCNNPGSSCATRYCSDKPTQACTTDGDCQAAAPPAGPPTTGLLIHYKYDEPAGTVTVVDHAGGDQTGAFAGGGAKRAAGYGSTGSALDCSGQGFTRVWSNVQLGNTVTMSTWYRRSGTGDQKIMSWPGGYELTLWSDNTFGLILGGNFGTWPRVSGAAIQPDTWTHIAATWNGSEAKFYVNGNLVGTQAASQTISAATKELVVCQGPGPNYFNPTGGQVDNTRVYNTALTDAEVQSIFQAETTTASTGLFGHWAFDGNTSDSSGNGADATFASPVYVAGYTNQAADRSTGGSIEVANTSNVLDKASTKLTMTAWFKRPASPALAADEMLVARELSGGIGYRLLMGPSGTLCGQVDSSGGLAMRCTASPSFGTWHHLAVTWDGSTGQIKAYIDGVLDGTSTASAGSIAASSGVLTIGANDPTGGNKFQGAVDDVRLYNTVLSASEISQLVGGKAEPDLVLRLDFENNGADSSGAGNNATAYGGPSYAAGKYGQAASLSGAQHFQIPMPQGGNADVDPGPYTITAWFNQTAVSTATYATWLVNRQRDGSWAEDYGLGIEMSGQKIMSNPENSTGAYDTVAVTNGQWTFAATTVNAGVVDVWKKVGATPVAKVDTRTYTPGSNPSTGDIYIGAEDDDSGTTGKSHFRGLIDDVRIYKRVLTQTELEAVAAGNKATEPASGAQTNSNLLGHWKFDEGSGVVVADQSVYNNPIQNYCSNAGTNTNQTGAGCSNGLPNWQVGHTGAGTDKALHYPYWAYGQLPASVLSGKATNQITVSAWVYRLLNNAGRWVIHQQLGNFTDDAFGIWFPSGVPTFVLNNGSFNESVSDTVAAGTGTWVHYVGTYDGTTMKLYKNGTLVDTNTQPGFVFAANSNPIIVGAGANGVAVGGEFLDGYISELAIWNKALTSTEVTALAANTLPQGAGAFCKVNTCNGQDNSCNVALNVCQGGQVNQCIGVNNSDVCVINQANKGPAKMCRMQQTFCAVDSHCSTYPGDECVPATSRSVVAKRVLKNVLLNNSDIMNFGLMAFSQGSADGTTWDRNKDGVINTSDKDSWPDDYYFPYYKIKTGGGGTNYQDRYFTRDELEEQGCYSNAAGPDATCVVGSTTYTLRSGVNARYTVYKHGGFIQVDQPFCGDKCVISSISQGWLIYEDDDDFDNDDRKTDARGTGRFAGARYTYPVSSGDYDLWDQPTFLKTYQGRSTTIAGEPYIYFKPRNDYYWNPQAGANRPPIRGAQCADKCSAECGGSWDPNLIPLIDTSDVPATSKANVVKMLPMLEKARDGGFMHWERGPVGCALINDFAAGAMPAPADKKRHSAWNYLEDVNATDPIPCRDDFILLITDGETNGPGDVDATGTSTCFNPDCRVQWDDPNASVGPTCQCKSVINALKLRQTVAKGGLNVKTYVIGFSPDSNIGIPGTVNENIARAGGTCRAPFDNTLDPSGTNDKCMFLANNETELQEAIQAVIFDAIKGSYSTTPASATSGTQVDEKKVTPGGILFDARVDFPSWRGHLLAYDTADIDPVTLQPKLMWDAGSPANFPDPNDVLTYKNWTAWKKRLVYTSAGGVMVPFQIEPNSGAILNRDQLLALGLGNTDVEAERIAQWMLGDPRQRNKAVLGAFVNSTPIEVGPAGLSALPGGKRFFDEQKNRISLVYAAGDDGLLHAFFTRDTTVGGRAFKGGEEAFAYIPPDMLRAVTNLYTQGGQKADPRQHVFGLTSSPKMKNVCWQNCDDDATAVWKSILVMTDGWGGQESFMLDVTTPFVSNNFNSPPINIIWHTDTVTPADKALFDAYQGDTVSVPAFYYGKGNAKDDYRVVYASGYRSNPPTSSAQGITLLNVSARNGALLDSDTITASACSIEHTALTDVAAARNFDFREQQQMLGAFFGDTWGNLWRYVPSQVGANNNTGTTGNLSLVKGFGCNQPLHFAPTIVQLDRDDPLNHPGDVYVVQVTNSALDPETEAFAPSKMIIRKETRTSSAGGIAPDLTWTGGGQLEFVVGTSSMCGIWDPSGNSGAGACTQVLPANARPTSTPLAVLKADGTGFLIMSLWYAPPTTVCGFGRSYLLLHTMDVGSYALKQRAGLGLVNEAVTSAVIVDKKVVYTDSQGKVHDVTNQLNQTFLAGGAISDVTRNGGLRFQQTGWMELP